MRAKLARQAQTRGLLDVAWRSFDSPVGPLVLAATESGLVRVAFALDGEERVLTQLARELSPRILHSPPRLDAAARELDEFFARTRRRFDVPLDLRLASGFRRKVVSLLSQIDYGQTCSYAELAAAAGSPRAMRAVGSACATNPLPLLLPCHRVLRSDGGLGGYGGGLEAKRMLLELESEASG
ncbi:MAG: methylated-DNA--[protein]-cysteine S-methyltransferase [Solirubrobacteraceae bacterium]